MSRDSVGDAAMRWISVCNTCNVVYTDMAKLALQRKATGPASWMLAAAGLFNQFTRNPEMMKFWDPMYDEAKGISGTVAISRSLAKKIEIPGHYAVYVLAHAADLIEALGKSEYKIKPASESTVPMGAAWIRREFEDAIMQLLNHSGSCTCGPCSSDRVRLYEWIGQISDSGGSQPNPKKR